MFKKNFCLNNCMAVIKLDLKDKKILDELDLNARYFISDIAKKVQLNKEVVKYRIHNLEKKNVITEYRTLINYGKLGLNLFRVGINLIDITDETINEIQGFLKDVPSLHSLHQCDTNWDLVFTILVNDKRDFYKFYESFKGKFKKYVETQQLSILTDEQVFTRSLAPSAKKKNAVLDYCQEKVSFDKTDIDILQVVAHDAKCPLIDIAKKLDLDSMTVKRRIEGMVKKGIIAGFKTEINPRVLGIKRYYVKLGLFDTSSLSAFSKHIATLKETVAITDSIGDYDFEFELEVADYFELEDLMNTLRKQFPIIREINWFSPLRTIPPNAHEQLGEIIPSEK